jgi:hypothetical protein
VWLEKLDQASQQVKLWKIAKSGILNKLDTASQLESAAAAANFQVLLNLNLQHQYPSAQGPEDNACFFSQCHQRLASIPTGLERTHSPEVDTLRHQCYTAGPTMLQMSTLLLSTVLKNS